MPDEYTPRRSTPGSQTTVDTVALERLKREMAQAPDQHGFGRMFAHASAPLRVVQTKD